MAGTPWGSIISAIAGHIDNTKTNIANLGSNLMTNFFNYKMNERNNALQQRLADQANQWQIEQRDYENWFNSPAGLQSRGLNPALAMANGGAALAGSNSAGEAHVAETQPFRASQPVFQSDANSALAAAQIANLDADTANKWKEVPIKDQQLLNLRKEWERIEAHRALYQFEALSKNEEFNKLLNENNLFYETWNERVLDWRAKGEVARWEFFYAKDSCEKRLQALDASINQLKSSKQVNDALSKLYGAERDRVIAEKNNLEKVHEELIEKVKLLTKQAELIEKYGDVKEVMGMINETLTAIAHVEAATASFISALYSRGNSPTINFPSSSTSSSY